MMTCATWLACLQNCFIRHEPVEDCNLIGHNSVTLERAAWCIKCIDILIAPGINFYIFLLPELQERSAHVSLVAETRQKRQLILSGRCSRDYDPATERKTPTTSCKCAIFPCFSSATLSRIFRFWKPLHVPKNNEKKYVKRYTALHRSNMNVKSSAA